MCIRVEDFRASRLEPYLVRAAVGSRDIVDERKNVFGITRRMLHRDVNLYAVLFRRDMNRFQINRVLFGVDIRHEVRKTAFVMINALFSGTAFVFGTVVVQDKRNRLVQKSDFAKTRRNDLVIEFFVFENARIRLERNLRARLFGFPDKFQTADGNARLDFSVDFGRMEVLTIFVAVLINLDGEPL